MQPHPSEQAPQTILFIAASRGLGLAMAEDFLKKGLECRRNRSSRI